MEWNDKAFVLMKVKKNGHYLRNASEDLKKDREIVLGAIKNATVVVLFGTRQRISKRTEKLSSRP